MVLLIVPVVGISFFLVFRKVKKLFRVSQETIDWLNRIIHENILGAGLIRILNSQQYEYDKFIAANTASQNVGIQILRLFASLMPLIMFSTNAATLIILTVGGHFVIAGSMSL